MTNDRPPAFESLREVSKGDAQREIPQLHWERLVGLGYAVRRLGELGLTASGIRRLAAGNYSLPAFTCSWSRMLRQSAL
jgi:hypothetical protein